MLSAELREILDVLRAAGVSKATVPLANPAASLHVEFAPSPVAPEPLGLVDAAGKPVDLDEGAGPLTRDPFANDPDDADPVSDIESKNTPKVPA